MYTQLIFNDSCQKDDGDMMCRNARAKITVYFRGSKLKRPALCVYFCVLLSFLCLQRAREAFMGNMLAVLSGHLVSFGGDDDNTIDNGEESKRRPDPRSDPLDCIEHLVSWLRLTAP